MKFGFSVIIVAFVASLIWKSSEAAIGAPNTFGSPPPSGICRGNKRGLKPADGTQIANGFCSSQLFGEIPSSSKMVSTRILFPQNGGFVKSNQNFTAQVKSVNLNTGFFSDAATDYYDLPQQLGANGAINGHNHIVIQSLGGPTDVPDPTVFAFFKGLNDPADGSGVLNQVVGTANKPGLSPGVYRMCTMTSSFTHQPLIMPIAQRGPQDDCVNFFVK
ncbi:1147_t:CDS:1 [Acaulospora morrowiae]|uniref:1147_t:CDS:1 n=1 Tax=Acaulospora morrowiae TaxID=94023 RepID=A0A9N9GT18_9GLOM|nr:1147_t:CDS:1 [Acaulospora morrowiae]